MKLNLPNKLTLLRLVLVPVFVVIMLVFDALWAQIAGLVIFIAASLTDMLDGKIARKYNLITDFGKFLDPLADKFMVIGALMVILYKSFTHADVGTAFRTVLFCAVLVVIFRELAVTSMRLVVSGSSGIVVAANLPGKIKTCTQIASVILCIFEPMLYRNVGALNDMMKYLPASWISVCLMTVFTVWSGVNYLVAYWKYLDPQK